MQISPAISSALRAISSAPRSELRASADAAACAYGPPLPIAAIPSSGSITSPVPESTKRCSGVPTINSASKRRNARSWRQSLASSTAARVSSLYSLNFASNFSSSVIPSAAEPAKPAITRPPAILRTFRAPCLTIVLSSVTWPSPAIASIPLRRIARIVVDRIFISRLYPSRDDGVSPGSASARDGEVRGRPRRGYRIATFEMQPDLPRAVTGRADQRRNLLSVDGRRHMCAVGGNAQLVHRIYTAFDGLRSLPIERKEPLCVLATLDSKGTEDGIDLEDVIVRALPAPEHDTGRSVLV